MQRMTSTHLGISFALALAVVSLTAPLAESQGQSGDSPSWSAPLTPWGDPDLQGIWTTDGHAPTPMERPSEFGLRELLTPEEIAERVERESVEWVRLGPMRCLAVRGAARRSSRGQSSNRGLSGRSTTTFGS